MKKLNIISKPVERWFHYDKPLPIEMPKDSMLHIAKDDKGRDVFCWYGLATFKLNREFIGMMP